MIQDILFIGSGIFITLKLLVGGILIGFFFGLIAAILVHQNIAKGFINFIILILRGTPIILQLAFVYFAIPSLIPIRFDIITAGIITFGINSSAYVAEIFRSGIKSISEGQFEAAKVLKIPKYQTWKTIILPQVIKNIFPALINEVIALLKETALIATVGGMDIMRLAQTIAAENFNYFTPLCIAGSYYFVMVFLIGYFGKKLEEKVYAKN